MSQCDNSNFKHFALDTRILVVKTFVIFRLAIGFDFLIL